MLNYQEIYSKIAGDDRRTALLKAIYSAQEARRERLDFNAIAAQLGCARGTVRRDVGQLAGMHIITIFPDGTLQINSNYIDGD